MMNIWEEAYSKHKEGNRILQSSSEEVSVQTGASSAFVGVRHFVPSSNSGSFEELYQQIGQSHQPAPSRNSHESTHEPAPEARQEPAPGISVESPQPDPAIKRAAETVSSNSSAMRFNPRIQSDKLPTPYPAVLYKMHSQLSDIWGNILVETKQSVEMLLICGATRKEGNTFVSFHLAMFLSKEYNMKILYVDINPNHAVIPKIKNFPGFFNFVSEKRELSSLIVQTEYPGLYLLPSGSEKVTPHDGAVMLSREPIETLIQYCRRHFDITIIDGQPITMSPVMIEFARMVDMTALVCRYGYSRREVSRMAIDKLQKFGVNSIGVILNDRLFPIPQKLYKLMG